MSAGPRPAYRFQGCKAARGKAAGGLAAAHTPHGAYRQARSVRRGPHGANRMAPAGGLPPSPAGGREKQQVVALTPRPRTAPDHHRSRQGRGRGWAGDGWGHGAHARRWGRGRWGERYATPQGGIEVKLPRYYLTVEQPAAVLTRCARVLRW